MDITTITLGGREAKLAPAPFSEEVCELIELVDQASEAIENKTPFRKSGRITTLIRKTAIKCMIAGGHSAEEADEILNGIPVGPAGQKEFNKLGKALGVI